MLVHHYHPETGVYLGSSQAHHDPGELALRRNGHVETARDKALTAYDAAVKVGAAAVVEARRHIASRVELAAGRAARPTMTDRARSIFDADFAAAREAMLSAIASGADPTQAAAALDRQVQAAMGAFSAAQHDAKLNADLAHEELQAAIADAHAEAAAFEPEHWMLPAHATFTAPPATVAERKVAAWRETEWVEIDPPAEADTPSPVEPAKPKRGKA